MIKLFTIAAVLATGVTLYNISASAEQRQNFYVPYPPPIEEPIAIVPYQPSIEEPIAIIPITIVEPSKPKQYIYGPIVYVVPMRVTACSPQDPKDAEYYAKNGYEGDAYGIAAYKPHYPVGTQMRIPGYMNKTWEEVDSSGGSVIRRSTRQGKQHIDVKFRTLHSVNKWGSQNLDVEVILPKNATSTQRKHIESIADDSYPLWVKEIQ